MHPSNPRKDRKEGPDIIPVPPPTQPRVTAAAALRELPFAHIFELYPDDTLFEVILMSCAVLDESVAALVRFVPHGKPGTPEIGHPVMVSAKWFAHLMPASIFMDIPDDAASISPLPAAAQRSGVSYRPAPGRGAELAARWRARRRPTVTTIEYVEDCFPLTPSHLLPFALDAVEALESGSSSRAAREKIATYCELIDHHLASSVPQSDNTE